MMAFDLFLSRCLKVLSISLCFSAATAVSADEKLKVLDAWSPPMPPGVSVRAGYLTLLNESDEEITVTRFQSPAFNMIEVHQTNNHSGVMSMSEVSQLTIPAGEILHLEPGGLHLMMMGLNRNLNKGDRFSIALHCSDERVVRFNVAVRRQYGEFSGQRSHAQIQSLQQASAYSL